MKTMPRSKTPTVMLEEAEFALNLRRGGNEAAAIRIGPRNR